MNALPFIAVALFVLALSLWKPLRAGRGRFRSGFAFLVLWLAIWWVPFDSSRDISLALIELAALQIVAGIVFDLTGRLANPRRFLIEMGVVASYVVILFDLLRRLGVNVTGIFATSAVATAVLGLALQDMLSNIAGGVALELERSLSTGDFIKCGDAAGWVQHVSLRHTAIESPDGDRIILPNSFLTRSTVTVLAKPRRCFVPFTMPYGRNPHDMMETVTEALRSSPIQGIAPLPKPECVIREMATGHIVYTAVVWLREPGRENTAVSEVLNRIYFALLRAGNPISEITTLVEMKQGSESVSQNANPVDVLRTTPIFRLLDEPTMFELAARLYHQSFAPGEWIVRQGQQGDSMYFVTSGEVSIDYSTGDLSENQVGLIGPGDFFGESSLLTGEARNASAVAVTRVDCYKLDKSGLQRILAQHPALAEDMSTVITHRQIQLDVVRDKLDQEAARLREAESGQQMLVRIRRFFGLEEDAASA
ncbi:MAG TPA: mechanosensitive ion channel family protein [Bryobacteraceae bacterium]|nr:mechanosensitive ion channel family protein [Bryobacteraceae bacterium]